MQYIYMYVCVCVWREMIYYKELAFTIMEAENFQDMQLTMVDC